MWQRLSSAFLAAPSLSFECRNTRKPYPFLLLLSLASQGYPKCSWFSMDSNRPDLTTPLFLRQGEPVHIGSRRLDSFSPLNMRISAP